MPTCRRDTSVRLLQQASQHQVALPTGETKLLSDLDYWQLLEFTLNSIMPKNHKKNKGRKQ